MPTYTEEEVKKHNTVKDCWVIYKKKVYNVTDFAPDHPGGSELLTDEAGSFICLII